MHISKCKGFSKRFNLKDRINIPSWPVPITEVEAVFPHRVSFILGSAITFAPTDKRRTSCPRYRRTLIPFLVFKKQIVGELSVQFCSSRYPNLLKGMSVNRETRVSSRTRKKKRKEKKMYQSTWGAWSDPRRKVETRWKAFGGSV